MMRDKKMKRKDLIERAGISYATIAKLEKGRIGRNGKNC